MGTGPGIGIVAPLVSEKQRSVASPETDIDDDDAERRKRENDNKLNRDDDLKMNRDDDPKLDRGDGHRKSDKFDDDKKKGDKSKRKESDKSKDKKSGFFGRLRSSKDKDSKKGKGKETDIDSAPGSPTSPDSAYQVKNTPACFKLYQGNAYVCAICLKPFYLNNFDMYFLYS